MSVHHAAGAAHVWVVTLGSLCTFCAPLVTILANNYVYDSDWDKMWICSFVQVPSPNESSKSTKILVMCSWVGGAAVYGCLL